MKTLNMSVSWVMDFFFFGGQTFIRFFYKKHHTHKKYIGIPNLLYCVNSVRILNISKCQNITFTVNNYDFLE